MVTKAHVRKLEQLAARRGNAGRRRHVVVTVDGPCNVDAWLEGQMRDDSEGVIIILPDNGRGDRLGELDKTGRR
jgi:hypothetical protein